MLRAGGDRRRGYFSTGVHWRGGQVGIAEREAGGRRGEWGSR